MAAINQHIALAATDPIVELYKLDVSIIPNAGGAVYYFTRMTDVGTVSVRFGGISYTPIPIMGDGFVYSSTDAPAKPTLTISNVAFQVHFQVVTQEDFVGAILTRTRTFARFLDSGSTPNVAAHLPIDKFYVEKKVVHSKFNIQWQLTSVLDKSNIRLPRRQFLRKDFPGLSITRFRA